MALRIIRKISVQNCGNLWRNSISTSTYRFTNKVDNALSVKEPALIDNQLVLTPYEFERKKHFVASRITVTEPDVISEVSGIPEEHIKGRLVRIAPSVKNAMQSGTDNVGTWQLSFETRERWENPLMGWSSTGDPLSNIVVEFRDRSDAINYAEKNGWKWYTEDEKPVAPKVKSYGFNFSWNKRNRVSTK